jgi:Protein of unknown function (DUF3592)
MSPDVSGGRKVGNVRRSRVRGEAFKPRQRIKRYRPPTIAQHRPTRRGLRSASTFREWCSDQFDLYQSPYGKLMSVFQIGVKWVIVLVCFGFAITIPAIAVHDEIDGRNLRAHGTRASATVADVSHGSRDTSYLLSFDGPSGRDLEWTSHVEGAPNVGDVVPVLFDPADPTDVEDSRSPGYRIAGDSIAGVGGLLLFALGIMFLLMTPDDVIAFGKARFGR